MKRLLRIGNFLLRPWMVLLLPLFFLPADSPQGAFSTFPFCAKTPIPAGAWGASIFPDEPFFALQAAQEMLIQTDFASAQCFLDIAPSAWTKTSVYWLARGDAFWGLGDAPQAVSAWEKAGADTPQALSRLFNGYERTGQFEKASAACNAWLTMNPNDTPAKNRCAIIRVVLAPVGALPALDQAASGVGSASKEAAALAITIRDAQRNQDPAYLYARVGEELLAWEEAPLAEASLRKATSLRPDYGDAHALLGLALERQGKGGGDEYLLGVKFAPNSETACLFYGAWQRRNRQLDQARIWLERAWSLRPGDWAAASELAALEFETGHVVAGEQWLLSSVQTNPQEASAWLALADYYIRHEIQIAQNGIPAARQAVLLEPDNPHALELLGRAYFLTGDFALAESFFRRTLSISPDSASAHANLGLTLMQEGNPAEARIELRRAIQLDPNGDAGKIAQSALNQ